MHRIFFCFPRTASRSSLRLRERRRNHSSSPADRPRRQNCRGSLLATVYEELRRLAAAKMARESTGHTLQPTALVHEAWLRLGGDAQPAWANRAHFFGAAAEAMRRPPHGRTPAASAPSATAASWKKSAPPPPASTSPHPRPTTRNFCSSTRHDALTAHDPRKAELVKRNISSASPSRRPPMSSASRGFTAKRDLRPRLALQRSETPPRLAPSLLLAPRTRPHPIRDAMAPCPAIFRIERMMPCFAP